MTTSALLTALRVDPTGPFSDWLSDQELSDGSKKVYLSMFSKFARWAAGRGLALDECGRDDIKVYLDQNGVVKHHRYRFVRLIERFYSHLIHVKKLRIENPGSEAARGGVGLGDNDRMRFLSEREYTAVADYISRPARESGKNGEKQNPSAHGAPCSEWKEARDKALAGVLLFGALRVESVGLLSVNCISEDGERLKVPATGPIPYHESVFLPEGRASVSAWLEKRRAAGLPKTLMFPATGKGEAMHPASVYRSVNRIIESALEEAGLEPAGSRLSPQTLRNTYAGILIERGHPDRVIMECMGIKTLRSMERIRTDYHLAQQEP